MFEDSWVRSVYLYVMCGVSMILVVLGLSTAIAGLVHTIAPDLGHRDTLDRVGIGVSNIASEVVDIANEASSGDAEDFCEDVSSSAADFDECMDDELSSFEDSFSSIEDGIAEVKDELTSQIRYSSIDQMIRGVLMVMAGAVLFRIHAGRTQLFADGLMPKRRSAESEPVELDYVPPEA